MNKQSKKIMVAGLSIASVVLVLGVGYSMGQGFSSLRDFANGAPANTPGLVIREIPMDVIPGEATPPGNPEPGETPVPTPGATAVPTP